MIFLLPGVLYNLGIDNLFLHLGVILAGFRYLEPVLRLITSMHDFTRKFRLSFSLDHNEYILPSIHSHNIAQIIFISKYGIYKSFLQMQLLGAYEFWPAEHHTFSIDFNMGLVHGNPDHLLFTG